MDFAVKAVRFPSGKAEPHGDYIEWRHPEYGLVTHPQRIKAMRFNTREVAEQFILNERLSYCWGVVEIRSMVEERA